MPWFNCDLCSDSIKKPKLAKHFQSCRSHSFTCVDCSTTFDRESVQAHSKCVTEHEKYALGATKPGGKAKAAEQAAAPEAAAASAPEDDGQPVGEEHLSSQPPWKCNLCNVSCTSQDNLVAHACGIKHKRKVKAAATKAAKREGGGGEQEEGGASPEKKGKKKRARDGEEGEQNGASASKQASKGDKKGKKEAASDSGSGSDSDSEDEAADKKQARRQRKLDKKKAAQELPGGVVFETTTPKGADAKLCLSIAWTKLYQKGKLSVVKLTKLAKKKISAVTANTGSEVRWLQQQLFSTEMVEGANKKVMKLKKGVKPTPMRNAAKRNKGKGPKYYGGKASKEKFAAQQAKAKAVAA